MFNCRHRFLGHEFSERAIRSGSNLNPGSDGDEYEENIVVGGSWLFVLSDFSTLSLRSLYPGSYGDRRLHGEEDGRAPDDDSSPTGGPCFRFFFRREASEPLQVLKLRTVESSFAPAYKSWGSKLLLLSRILLALYFTGVGIVYDWIDAWHGRVLPPVYLTNWGLVAVAFYYITASVNSIHSVCFHSRTQTLSRWWRWLTAIQIFLFELTVVLESLITILYWSFEQQGVCRIDCVTGHALANGCLLIELFFSRMPIRPRHVILTIVYPILWVGSQVAWVYTDHPPAYPDALTMRNTKSIAVVILGLVAFVVCHFLFWLVALARDKFCAGRFYSDEGKEFDPQLPR